MLAFFTGWSFYVTTIWRKEIYQNKEFWDSIATEEGKKYTFNSDEKLMINTFESHKGI